MTPVSGSKPRSGILLLRKNPGLTSFQALSPIKRRSAGSKVGHAGTLDRFAEGLLVVLVGRYTRLVPYVVPGEKLYRGVVRFGTETSTLDPEGVVVAEGPLPTRELLESVLPGFTGKIMQRPPAYSAIHVDGKRAYKRALAGEDVVLDERPVEIRECRLEAYESGEATLLSEMLRGTYIRSLARDVALACGSRGHLVRLERLAIGPFSVDDAVLPEDFDPDRDLKALGPAESLALGLPCFSLGERHIPLFLNGMPIACEEYLVLGGGGPMSERIPAVVFAEDERLVGVVELEQGRVHYRAVIGSVGVKVVDWADFSSGGDGMPLAAAIGVFDGLHLGHTALIGRVLERGSMRRGVVTFKENPKRLLRPSGFHGNLTSLAQKLELLEAAGLEICVLIDFSGDFSKMAGRKFLALLRERGNLRYIAVGSDFRCGHRLDTGAQEMREFFAPLGVEADILDPVLRTGHPVSSSRIRKAVVDGRLEDARGMLGRDFELDLRGSGQVLDGQALLFAAGDAQVRPLPGLYDADFVGAGGTRAIRAAFDGAGWEIDVGGPEEAPFFAVPQALRLKKLVSTR